MIYAPYVGQSRPQQAVSLPCANIVKGAYRYTGDLLMLATAIASHFSQLWPRYQTPIHLEKLMPFLASHPDPSFSAYILDGLSNRFRIGFDHSKSRLSTRGSNHPSALANESVVEEHIAAEVMAGRASSSPDSFSPHQPLGLGSKATPG